MQHFRFALLFLALVIAFFILTAARAEEIDPERLKELGAAPELNNKIWINTDKPLRLSELRGQVVLLEFWTFGCYNCVNTFPAMKDWHAKYKDKGLVIIGDHFPEFSYEREIDNVRSAIKKFGIEYAVAIDNDGATW